MSLLKLKLTNVKLLPSCSGGDNLPIRNLTSRVTKCSQALISFSPLNLDHHLGSANHDPLDLPPLSHALHAEGHKRISVKQLSRLLGRPSNKRSTRGADIATERVSRKKRQTRKKMPSKMTANGRYDKKESINRKRCNRSKSASFYKNDPLNMAAFSNLNRATASNNCLIGDQPGLLGGGNSLKRSNGLSLLLKEAIREENKAIVVELIESGADVKEGAKIAIHEGQLEILGVLVRAFIEQGNSINDEVDERGNTLLQLAAERGAVECMQVLIDNGTDAIETQPPSIPMVARKVALVRLLALAIYDAVVEGDPHSCSNIEALINRFIRSFVCSTTQTSQSAHTINPSTSPDTGSSNSNRSKTEDILAWAMRDAIRKRSQESFAVVFKMWVQRGNWGNLMKVVDLVMGPSSSDKEDSLDFTRVSVSPTQSSPKRPKRC